MNDRLLEILACPVCKTAVRPADEQRSAVVCVACGRRYPVRDGIPVMLVEEAELQAGDGGSPPSGNG